jgi:signal transduction histidine kinase
VLGAVTRHDGVVNIEIENRAPGLQHMDIARIGEPFWRHSKSRTEQGHLGLGVHLARTIAQAMGGDVAIENERAGVIRATVSAPAAS